MEKEHAQTLLGVGLNKYISYCISIVQLGGKVSTFKSSIPSLPANLYLGDHPKEIKDQRCRPQGCSRISITALFMTATGWKKTNALVP